MTDRELLELAAKAAGLNVRFNPRFCGGMGAWERDVRPVEPPFSEWLLWNPLTDDGDAMRLAVKLGIQIGNPYQYRKALAFIDTGHGVDWEYREHWEDFDEEPYAATRLAITRAAAEIGKKK